MPPDAERSPRRTLLGMSRAEFDPNFPYGLDRPRQARGTLSAGMGLGVLALVLAFVLGDLGGPNGLIVLVLLIAFVATFVVSAGLFRTSRTTKVRAADRMLDGLDLSSLRALVNASETVTHSSQSRFLERFARVGAIEYVGLLRLGGHHGAGHGGDALRQDGARARPWTSRG